MTNDPKRYFFTPRGFERLRARVAEARGAYKAICNNNPEAREAGDSSVWHDNFAFEENQRQMHQLSRRVRDLEHVLNNADVVGPDAKVHHVSVGARVRYQSNEGEERTVLIAGWDDGDPAAQRVSYNSPLGAALVGAAVGDEREVVLGGRTRTLEILAIHVGEDT